MCEGRVESEKREEKRKKKEKKGASWLCCCYLWPSFVYVEQRETKHWLWCLFGGREKVGGGKTSWLYCCNLWFSFAALSLFSFFSFFFFLLFFFLFSHFPMPIPSHTQNLIIGDAAFEAAVVWNVAAINIKFRTAPPATAQPLEFFEPRPEIQVCVCVCVCVCILNRNLNSFFFFPPLPQTSAHFPSARGSSPGCDFPGFCRPDSGPCSAASHSGAQCAVCCVCVFVCACVLCSIVVSFHFACVHVSKLFNAFISK